MAEAAAVPSTPTPLPLSTSPLPASTPATTAATPTPTPTSTPPTTTTTNAATSTPSTSSSSTTSTTSAATSTQSSLTAATSASALTSAQVVTSGGAVETITSTSFVISTPSPTAQNNAASSNSFFHSQGAVAGVFTVVGLIVVGLAIALIVNAIRRRQAQKFDRDVAEAAAEAAASSRSPFDDYGGVNGYSDNSHGTYQMPPLPAHGDHYGTTEMSQFDPYAAGAASLAASAVGRSRSRKDSEPGAPGIAGVGAGTLAREPSKRAPYHAFAGPGPQPHELQGSSGTFRSQRSNQDILEAAGLAPAANNTGAFVNRQPSNTTQHTLSGRSKFGSMSSGGHHPQTLQPGYPVESYYTQRNDTVSPDPFAGYPPVTTAPSNPLPNPYDATSSPSLPGHGDEHNADDGDVGSPTALRSDEPRTSYQDNTDYSQGNRVLRVANE